MNKLLVMALLFLGVAGSVAQAANAYGIYSNNGSNLCTGFVCNGNVIGVQTGTGTGISLDYITDGLVSGNTIWGTGGGSVGMSFGSHNSNLYYGPNVVIGCTTPINVGNATYFTSLTT